MRRVNAQPPWQIGWRAVEFLVDEVAQPCDGLAQRQTQCRAVQIDSERQPAAADVEEDGKRATDEAAEDVQAALHHIDDLEWVSQIAA